MMRGAALAAFASALALMAASGTSPAARPRLQQNAECPRPSSSPGADSLVRTGRFWHASRVLPPLRPGRTISADSVLLPIAVAEGLGHYGEVEALLARARGGDSSSLFLLA